MKKSLFGKLVKSLKESKAIKQGRTVASRRFVVRHDKLSSGK